MLAAAALAACSGGGQGGATSPPPALSLLFSPASIAVTVLQGSTSHVVEQASASNLSQAVTVTVEQVETIAEAAITVVQNTASTWTLSFDTASALTPGVHSGSLRVHLRAGGTDLPGSPFLLPYDITVTSQPLDALVPYTDQTGLRLFDPRSPVSSGNPATAVDTPTSGYQPLMAVGFNGTNFTGLHPDSVVYVKSGSLFRVALAPGVSHAPAQLSNLTTVCQIWRIYNDYANVNHSAVLVGVQDNAGACPSNSPLRLVSAGATATQAAISVPGSHFAEGIRDANGALAGYLTYEAPAVVWRDTAYANPQTLLTAFDTGTAGYHGLSYADGDFTDTVYFVSRDAAQPAPTVYRFRPSTKALTPIVAFAGTDVPLFAVGAVDASTYYFGSGSALYRVPHNSTTVTRMSSAGFTDELRYPVLTANRVVAEGVNNGSSAGIYSLPKTASDASPVTIVDSSHGFASVSNADPSGLLFITAANPGHSPQWTSWIANDDGTGVTERPGSFWRIPIYDGAWDPLTRTATRYGRVDDTAQLYPIAIYDSATGALLTSPGGVSMAAGEPYAVGFGHHFGMGLNISRSTTTDYDGFVIDSVSGSQVKPVLNSPGAPESGGFDFFTR